MNTLSNFSAFALTRGEMKSVSGGLWSGSCRCNNGGGFTAGGLSSGDFVFLEHYYCGNGGSSCGGKGTL